jgi:hypothetical protein
MLQAGRQARHGQTEQSFPLAVLNKLLACPMPLKPSAYPFLQFDLRVIVTTTTFAFACSNSIQLVLNLETTCCSYVAESR